MLRAIAAPAASGIGEGVETLAVRPPLSARTNTGRGVTGGGPAGGGPGFRGGVVATTVRLLPALAPAPAPAEV
jgi:hypothetical protein